jgi:hypothetical protein
MTPEKEAITLHPGTIEWILNEAVKAEREACAKVAEDRANLTREQEELRTINFLRCDEASVIASAIRRRHD